MKKFGKCLLSALLVVLMVCTMLPTAAFAAENVQMHIFRNGNTTAECKKVDLDPKEKGTELDLTTININDYYSSTYGFTFKGWYGDWYWSKYKSGENPSGQTALSINGWTNIFGMVLDKYPVYANVYANGNVDKPVASTLLGNYEHGTAMSGIITENGLDNSLESIFTPAYEYEWDKAWGHEVQNIPYGLGEKAVGGWTNLSTMVYSKENVVYFNTQEDIQNYQNAETRDPSQVLFSTKAVYGSTLPTEDAPTAVREGYTFKFWSREGQIGTDVTDQTVKGWTNLVGNWDANQYQIIYHGNGGTLANGKEKTTSNVTFDQPYTIKNNPFIREGWTFLGWAESADGYTDDIVYTGGNKIDAYTTVGNTEYYAVWTPNTTPVDYDGNVKYIVEHYRAEDHVFPNEPTDVEILVGEVGETVTAAAKTDGDYEHYCLQPGADGYKDSAELVKLEKDGDIVVLKLYYDLKIANLTITKSFAGIQDYDIPVEDIYFTLTVDGKDAGNELWLEEFDEEDGVYSITIPAYVGEYTLTENGAELDDFDLETTGIPETVELWEDGAQVDIVNTYARHAEPIDYDGNVKYIVEHYRAEDHEFPTEPTDVEILVGKVGETVTATPKTDGDYEHYCLQPYAAGYKDSAELVELENDEDIVILRLYYDLKIANLTITKSFTGIQDYDIPVEDIYFTLTVNGKDAGNELWLEEFDEEDGVYSITIPAYVGEYTLTEHNAELDGFDLETTGIPETVELWENGAKVDIVNAYARNAEPIVYNDNVKYIVEHYKANKDGDYPDAPTDKEILSGKIGNTVTAVAKDYEGYCLNPKAEGTVTSAKLVKIEKDSDIVVLKLFYDVEVKADPTPDTGMPDEYANYSYMMLASIMGCLVIGMLMFANKKKEEEK